MGDPEVGNYLVTVEVFSAALMRNFSLDTTTRKGLNLTQVQPPPKGGMPRHGAAKASHDRVFTIQLKGGIVP